jgi:RNA 2',3'-cyclic 3'-phosphodiesterase
MRLFVSLPLPPEIQQHLDLAVHSVTELDPVPGVQGGRPALRWVPEEQRHITLAFYGEVPDGAVDELTSDLRSAVAGFPPLRLQLRGAGVFSRQTLWIGVHEEARGDGGRWLWDEATGEGQSGRLVDLMAACEDIGARFATFERRDRRRAHVTLARARNRRADDGELSRRAQALSVYTGPPWTAMHARLQVSYLGAGKGGTPLHEAVADLAFAAR